MYHSSLALTDFKQKGKSGFFVVRVKLQKVAESKKKHFCNFGKIGIKILPRKGFKYHVCIYSLFQSQTTKNLSIIIQ